MENDIEKFDKLFAALSKFQGELRPALKGKQGYGYKYADIAAVIEAAREPLAKNGLCVIQPPHIKQDGSVVVKTILGHSSGQSIGGTYPVEPGGKKTSQDMGSALTYARRYAYMSILGLPVMDDDGSAASGKPTPPDEDGLNLYKETNKYLIENADEANKFIRHLKWVKPKQTHADLTPDQKRVIADGFDSFKKKAKAYATS